MEYEKIIIQWKELEVPEVLPRLQQLDLDSEFINTITGPRRAGKTYFCFQQIKNLLNLGTSKENVLYINFEDEKLLKADANDLDRLLDMFFQLSEVNEKQKIYLFLDEIQNVMDWDAWTRRIYDINKNIKIIITGSSSKLLSKEISTKLRGRVLNTEIYPLSFKEILKWQDIEFDLRTISYSKKRIQIKKEFMNYLSNGGYPAQFLSRIPNQRILQSYYNSMIFKDIVERHEIKEVKKLRVLAGLIFESVTKEITYNKFANKLKSIGFSLSKNTIIEYISYFEDAYLFFQNLKYEYSTTKQLGSIKKAYCIDNGLLNTVSFKFSDDRGKLMENIAYLELKRKGNDVYFNKGDYECDFIIKEKNKITQSIQVCLRLEEDTEKREKKGLLEAMEKFQLKKGLILTLDQKMELTEKGKKIIVKPLWKWLLE